MSPAAIPPDLKPLILALKRVDRFVSSDYPSGIFADNVYAHTLRCVGLARALTPLFAEPGFPINLELLSRILWIHDTVEIGLKADIPAPAKMVNPQLEALAEKTELHQAQNLLTVADFELWQQFERAKKVLTGQLLHEEILIEAVIARIIDVLDGNIHFNRSLVHYLTNHPVIDLPSHSLSYAFVTNSTYYSVVSHRTHWQPLKPLLEAEREYLQSLWSPLDRSLIPSPLHPHLGN